MHDSHGKLSLAGFARGYSCLKVYARHRISACVNLVFPRTPLCLGVAPPLCLFKGHAEQPMDAT